MDPLTLEAPLNPDVPLDPSNPGWIPAICWVGPRHLAGDDGRLYDTVADTLTAMGWTSLTMVRGLREPDEAPEDRQVVRSTVLHLSPDTLRWAQWVLADEPFLLGDLPIAWHVSARADTSSPLAEWSAYFTPDVPGEAIADFLVALDARRHPATPCGGTELVLETVTGHGWLLDIDQPHTGAMDATFTTHLSFRLRRPPRPGRRLRPLGQLHRASPAPGAPGEHPGPTPARSGHLTAQPDTGG